MIEVFDYWYFKIFKAFNDKWLEEKRTMMEFTQFFDRLYERDFLSHHHQYLQEYLDIQMSAQKKTENSSAQHSTESRSELLQHY